MVVNKNRDRRIAKKRRQQLNVIRQQQDQLQQNPNQNQHADQAQQNQQDDDNQQQNQNHATAPQNPWIDEALENRLTAEEQRWLQNHYEEEIFPNPHDMEFGSSKLRSFFQKSSAGEPRVLQRTNSAKSLR